MSLRILIAYSMSSTYVQTTLDYLLALKRYSGFDVSYVHVTHDAVMNFDIDEFDIVFHNYCARLCFEGYVSPSYCDAMKRFRGLKVLAVQDEYNHTNVLKAAIRELGFHVVLTCVPQGSLGYVYPGHEFPDVEFVTVLTGYVPDNLAADPRILVPLEQRPIVVGYRGRDIGSSYGRLAFEKYEIGRRMREICEARGIRHDIAMDEASRIYGTCWFDFVGSCRSMLGSESGSNVFDFDGSIERTFREMAASRGGKVSYEEFLPIVAQRETEISMGQISPRVFECAAMKTPLILFRGQYSGIIRPNIHYIPLEKDFSNIDEVLARVEDVPALEAMAENTYEYLVVSGHFSYRAYSRQLRALIERKLDELAIRPRVVSTAQEFPGRSLHNEILAQAPTDQPSEYAQFELVQARWLISVLEPEVKRLSAELDKVSIAYLSEVTRLRGTFKSELEGALGNCVLEKVLAAIEVTSNGLERYANFCRDRRSGIESELSELRGRALADIYATGNSNSLFVNKELVAFLEREIGVLNNEINHVNKVGSECVSITHDAAVNLTRHLLRTPHLTFRIKTAILTRVLVQVISASAMRRTKQLILRLPFSRRMIDILRSSRPLRRRKVSKSRT